MRHKAVTYPQSPGTGKRRSVLQWYGPDEWITVAEVGEAHRAGKMSAASTSAHRSVDVADVTRRVGERLRHHEPLADEDIRSTFVCWAEEWQTATAESSSIREIVTHPAYLRIIGLGSRVVPFILRDLERQPDHWFSALFTITGENPVLYQDRGRVSAMAAAWISWGKERGLLESIG